MNPCFGLNASSELSRRRACAGARVHQYRKWATLYGTLLLVAIAGVGCARLTGENRQGYSTVPNEPNDDAERAKKFNTDAITKLENGKLEAAEALLRDALVADVDYGPAHNNLGQIYLRRRQLYLAAWEFQFASNLMPERPECLVNLGLVYETANRLVDARTAYEDAMAVAPGDTDAIGNLARVCVKLDDDPARIHFLLSEIVMRDDRPTWRKWAQDLLATKYQYAGFPPVGLEPAEKVAPPGGSPSQPGGNYAPDSELPAPNSHLLRPAETVPPPTELPGPDGDTSMRRASPLDLTRAWQNASTGPVARIPASSATAHEATARTVELVSAPLLPNLPLPTRNQDVQPALFSAPSHAEPQ